jgi:putative ABC transport system substrate-binding protein
VAAFWERLSELGWVKGQNLAVEERWADGRLERLPTLMEEIVDRKVDVIFTYNTPAGIAAKNATSSIPIVVFMGDPVQAGLAASLSHPGGNLTGLSFAWSEGVPGKYLELLKDIVPRLSTLAVITNPDYPPQLLKALQAAAPARRVKLKVIEVRNPESLDGAFDQAHRQAQAVFVAPNPMLLSHLHRVTALAAKHRLPTMYYLRDFVDAGGLLAYTPDFAVMFRRAAEYVDKILKGANPADLPIRMLSLKGCSSCFHLVLLRQIELVELSF